MLKRNQFQWHPEALEAFASLKEAMCKTPVLALPDFNKTFVPETDASQTGIRALLMQTSRPIAFLSKALPPRKMGLSTYKKEL